MRTEEEIKIKINSLEKELNEIKEKLTYCSIQDLKRLQINADKLKDRIADFNWVLNKYK